MLQRVQCPLTQLKHSLEPYIVTSKANKETTVHVKPNNRKAWKAYKSPTFGKNALNSCVFWSWVPFEMNHIPATWNRFRILFENKKWRPENFNFLWGLVQKMPVIFWSFIKLTNTAVLKARNKFLLFDETFIFKNFWSWLIKVKINSL